MGQELGLDLGELGVRGVGRVVSIGPCPELEEGDPASGRIVTGRFAHAVGWPMSLRLEGLAEPIGVTGQHLFWSVDRDDWVAAGELEPLERVRVLGATLGVVNVSASPRREAVYNLEVDGEHVYRVTAAGVLVHNASACQVLYRGDNHPFSATNARGQAKVHLVESGALVPANVSGLYEGARVRIIQHILGGFRSGAKAHSPYISFTPRLIVARGYGKEIIRLDVKALREAIVFNDVSVSGVTILSQRQLQAIISRTESIGIHWRRMAAGWSARDTEWIVKGIVPEQFLRLL